MTPLAEWLHDQGIGCRWEYRSPVDIGMGRDYTADHEPGHERDAVKLAAALREFDGVIRASEPEEGSRTR